MSFYDPDHYAPPERYCDQQDTCPTCHGDGETREEVCVGKDEWQLQTHRCPTCKGEGEIPADLDIPHRWEL